MEWTTNTSSPVSMWGAMSKLELQVDSSYQHHKLAALAGSSSSETVINNRFSVDLKLGRLQDREDLSISTLKKPGALNMLASSPASTSQSSGSSKRGQVRNGRAIATVFCSVDGCTSDLNGGRDYYRRHRVCERHSKTPVVLIGGREQRFCQQCSRFQSLGEFDEAKRSCRKRLEGHNRRRRKSQPETFYIPSAGFQPSQTGNRLLQFWSPQMNTVNEPVISQSEKTLYYSHHKQQTSLPDSVFWNSSWARGDKHCSFLTGISPQTVHQPLLNETTLRASRNGVKVSPEKLSESLHSECALSLLSKYPTQSSGTNTGHIIQPMATSSSSEGICTTLHLDNSLAQFPCPQGPQESSISLSSTSNSNAHSFGGFHSGLNGFCENGSSRVFPFAWE